MIDQNKLPFPQGRNSVEIFRADNYRDVCAAIKDMTIRGAPAIGAAAAYGLAQAFLELGGNIEYADAARQELNATRPTAQNLFYATERVFNAASSSDEPVFVASREADKIADEDVKMCKAIGRYGMNLIEDGFTIETHCNAGWLATVDWGTATAPIYMAKRRGRSVFVYVDETRPRNQGARLTAWELGQEGIPHAIIPDNAGAHYMSHGKIDLVIVGTDRVARNGDVANKIGTLEKAIVAARYGVPFYVAAPLSTFDLNCTTGAVIPIEERSEEEVLYQTGLTSDNRIERVLVCSPGSHALNPAFDVTPSELITGLITPKGIIKPCEEEIRALFA